MDRVHHEVAFLARHAHWTLVEVLNLDHEQRRRWVAELSALVDSDN